MFYITVMQHRKPKQITIEDVLFDREIFNEMANETSSCTATVTRKFMFERPDFLEKININKMIEFLNKFNKDNEKLFVVDRNDLYRSFKIPKSTGGFRQIDAPCAELQAQLQRLVNFLRDDCGMLYHTSAFAYVPKRSIVDNNKKHVNSDWFLKTDFSGFFPNTTLDFVMEMMSIIFPMSEVCKRKDGYDALRKAPSLGFLNGGLPQGTCLSPMLTNIFMIPIDHELFNKLAERNIVYTRYADDIHISAKAKFPYKEIVKLIEETLKKFNAPYVIKQEKTHFGSVKGKNWMLGLMVNANHEITVGYRNKKYFKAALCSFILDTKNGKRWEMEDVMHLRGQLSYYEMVEKDYFNNLIKQYDKKWNVDTKDMFKKYLNGTY